MFCTAAERTSRMSPRLDEEHLRRPDLGSGRRKCDEETRGRQTGVERSEDADHFRNK